jgi:putative ABC transport system permease protein
MNTLPQDLRYGLRMLAKNPGFTVVAVLTLALGIGANTAIFTVVNSILLRPLSLPQPERLIWLWHSFLPPNSGFGSVSYLDFVDWQQQNTVFRGLAAFYNSSFNLKGKSSAERVPGALVSANFFAVMGVEPKLGRVFLPEEDKPGGPRVAVLGEPLWRTEFGADPNIVGRTISLNEESYTVAGIVPASFRFPSSQVWAPLVPDEMMLNARGNNMLQVVGRLKAGVSLEQAQAQMDVIAAHLAKQYPDTNSHRGVRMRRVQDAMTGGIREDLLVLLAAVAFVFLIACANVVNLVLTRATARQREFAIRLALGAGRRRLVRQFLAESLLLALCGGALGWLLAAWGVHLLVALKPANLPRLEDIHPDARVLAFTGVASVLAAVTLGLAMALKASGLNMQGALKEGGTGLGGGKRHRRARDLLVIAEVALSLVLLIGAGLLIESLWQLRQVDPGLRVEHVLSMRLALPESKYTPQHPPSSFYQPVLEKVSALPGVQAAGLITLLPLQDSWTNGDFEIEGRANMDNGRGTAEIRAVSSDYYRAMGVPLFRGRYFSLDDTQGQPPVLIINKKLARSFWPEEDPVGKHVEIGAELPWYTIVGVVGDVRQSRLDDPVEFEIDVPYSQWPPSWPDMTKTMSLVLRTAFEPEAVADSVRRVILDEDPEQPVFAVATMSQVVTESMAYRRFNMLLFEIFAGLAVVLAALGIYGVLSYVVNQRTHEIGIRMALGAGRDKVLRMVVGEGMVLAGMGIALGLIGSFVLTRFLASLLYGVRPTDPPTFIVVALVLAAVSCFACYIPARRATKVDPMVALRYE